MKTVPLFLAAAFVLAAGPVMAQSADDAHSTLTIHRGLNVSAVRPMRLQPTPDGATLSLSAIELADGPALIEVSGDANRVYRVQIIGGDREASIQIWSVNAGDISVTRVGVMDSYGNDVLRISGDPDVLRRIAGDGSQIPLTIQYE